MPSAEDITRLARLWSDGDDQAFADLVEIVYDDLRRIARSHIRRGGADGTMNTTALVHEAYVRLAGAGRGEWPSRAHFFAFCSRAMRRILIDYARSRSAEKRGGDLVRVPLPANLATLDREVEEILALNQALTTLEERDPRMARVAECRFFGGLSVGETAEVIDTSPRTVERIWSRARIYLQQLLSAPPSPDGTVGGAHP
ncbi:MAG TPA: ECF-type sigma factor [Longimicrobiales bacterium]|nr:ECF-type sigma factor [Longimicrobiales bacterium]